ncbi:protein aspartic protease in guard cell 1 [Phtheirospermum japonicum]|uniref:Protein aspartic protease in guard cell 1 n=1 Tax=Phtheirospermum japonicum TaxID=374723 RepID=A0A830D888_9LAMI|nr:protein aspartic protease in guard cell 1 [Phtheirospermum japonicum]
MEYLARVGVGTPANKVYLALDTGSDVVWLQCRPCKKCYEQAGLIFDPRNSSSFSPLPCGDSRCQQLDSADYSNCDNPQSSCLYKFTYGDGSFSFGNLSTETLTDYMTETLTFRGTKLRKIIFGCGHDNEGLFVAAAGLLGLGRGKLSFPGQAGRRFRNKFSYCLVRRGSSGKSSILFGPTALSRKAVFTRLVHNPDPSLGTFYYVALEGISVGGKRVDIPPGVLELDREGNGGVILDSGTSVTRLAQPAYEAMRDAFQAWTKNLSQSSAFSLFDTCYDLSGMTEVTVPKVGLHFDGADMDLPAYNYLIPVDDNGKYCFAFAGKPSGLSIIGNIQQQGFRISYDLAKSRVGFTARSCV